MLIGDWILTIVATLLCVPFLIIGCEAFASLLPGKQKTSSGERPTCAVLIPAHNEEQGIAATVRNVREQLATGERILVVADNCADATAEIARNEGAEIVERTDSVNRGKGFALDCGLNVLDANPPAIVVVVDADCELGTGALDALIRQAAQTGRPAQGIYLIGTGKENDPRRRLSAFAVLLKNKIRPLGLYQLGLPSLLTGTGMAFPWNVIRSAQLGTGNIVEDMKLGVDLALAGCPPRLCPEAELSGAAAPDRGSAIKQRTRWEHGHVQTLIRFAPRLIAAGIIRVRPSLFGLGLELSVPPLSLVCAGWCCVVTLSMIWWQIGGNSWVPFAVSMFSMGFAGLAIFAAWTKFGRKMLPLVTLLLIPMYVLWKMPIYMKMLVAREKTWERTDRAQKKK